MFQIKKPKLNLTQTITLVVSVSLTVLLVTLLVRAWIEPSDIPPGGTVFTPVYTGPTAQTKEGVLKVKALSTYDETVSDNTIETGTLCLGNGTNCQSDWSEDCPSGFTDTGYGYCILTQGPASYSYSWHEASDYCADTYGSRLCTNSEWYNACINNIVSLLNRPCWTDNLTDNNNAIVRGYSTCEYVAVYRISGNRSVCCCRSK